MLSAIRALPPCCGAAERDVSLRGRSAVDSPCVAPQHGPAVPLRAPRMSLPYRVILLGFSPFERSALTSYFRLATNRSPAYEHADAGSEAHFLIVDADHAGVVEG